MMSWGIYVFTKVKFKITGTTSQPQNIPNTKRPKCKTSNDIKSRLQNFSTTKRPSYKTTLASQCPSHKSSQMQNVPSLKTSQASKHLKPQNVPTTKSHNSKHPKLLRKKTYIIY